MNELEEAKMVVENMLEEVGRPRNWGRGEKIKEEVGFKAKEGVSGRIQDKKENFRNLRKEMCPSY